MRKTLISVVVLIILSSLSWAEMGGMMQGGMHDLSPVPYNRESFNEAMHISRGGQLYDNWWRTTTNTDKPEADHPLWKTQTGNKRSGYSTYRCKECHGWDYLGKDGAYGKGSHYTGFVGVYSASQKMSINEIEAVLKGSTNRDHDFSKYIDNEDISDLALFIKKGLVDTSKLVKADGTPVGGNYSQGKSLFMNNCMHMCHGGDGTMINFGESEKPEFVGTVASNNPWELIHKVRMGQPGARMPSALINKWTEEDISNILAFTRTLPAEAPKTGWFRRMMGRMGMV
jgi:thiosulfate dehydrogenase